MPWLFQQGLGCSTFYHFYAHDYEGSIGITLRSIVKPFAVRIMTALGADEEQSQDDALFGKFVVGFFMVLMGIVRMDRFLGPRFSPFNTVIDALLGMMGGKKRKVDAKPGKSPSGAKKGKKKN